LLRKKVFAMPRVDHLTGLFAVVFSLRLGGAPLVFQVFASLGGKKIVKKSKTQKKFTSHSASNSAFALLLRRNAHAFIGSRLSNFLLLLSLLFWLISWLSPKNLAVLPTAQQPPLAFGKTAAKDLLFFLLLTLPFHFAKMKA